jgi:hypothetical protein
VCTRSIELITTRKYSPADERRQEPHAELHGLLKAFRSKRLAETRVVFAFVIGPISTNIKRRGHGDFAT